MNTNIHEWRKENKWITKIKKEIREHSCSFVAEILSYFKTPTFNCELIRADLQISSKEFQPRMNTNIHEWRKENKWITKIKKEIREHSCSFVAEILSYFNTPTFNCELIRADLQI